MVLKCKKCRFDTLRFILLGLLLAAGGLWLASDWLLDEVVRPWLTAKAAAALDAQVQLESLVYADGRLHLTGLTLARLDELRLDVAAIDVKFSWTGLLQHRIDELVIREPRLAWTATGQETTREPTLWPQAPPLFIDAWSVENGRIELAWGSRKFLFDQLAAEGGLGRQFPFALSALCGTAPVTPMRLAGDVRWQDGPVITLAELAWDGRNLLAQPVTLAPGADQTLGIQLSLVRLDDLELGGLLASLGEPRPWPAELHWQLTEPALNLRLRGQHLEASLQTAAGLVQTADQGWPWSDMALGLQGDAERLELTGHLGMAGATVMDFSGTWADRRLAGRWSLTAGNLTSLLQSVGVTLPTAAPVPRDLTMQGLIEADPDSARISRSQLAVSFEGLGTLAGDLQGEWREARLTFGCDYLTLTTPEGTSLAGAAISLAGSPAQSAWNGDWSMQVPDLARLVELVGYPLPDGLPGLQQLSVKGRLSLKDSHLGLTGIDLAGKLAGAGFSGLLHGQLALQTASDVNLRVILEALSLDALEYQAEDAMAGLVGGKLDLQGRLELAGERLRFDLSGQATAAEALVDSWYGSLQELPASFAVSGSWSNNRQRLELAAADVDLAGLVSGHFTGFYAAAATSLRGQIAVPQMQGAFQQTLQALAGELLPNIRQVALDGQLRFDGAARRQQGGWELDLAILPSGVTIAWGEAARIEGLDGRLPLYLRQGPLTAEELTETASLQWSRLQGRLFDSGPGRLELQASPNSWQLRQPLELAVASGRLRLTALQFDLPELVPHLKASFEVQDAELRQITSSLGWPELSGRLNARLQEVRIAADEISTVGAAAIRVFGGDFTINNMRVEAPFSRFPTYNADVDFTGIDLYQLTNTFEFGEMNGVADGYIHNLRLFDGTPSALQAKLETRSEGTRNISVKAIRNLNTLSMGGLSSALSQGIYQFIDFYRYRKIGIVCRLQNDVFHLEGIAREGSDQYLVYGGLLPPRIDVVVSSPTVSFKEMVGRLKRIERTEH